MKILITGIAGFFGHHLLEHILKNTDFEVVGLEGINYAGSLNRVTDISVFKEHEHRIKMVWHDLRSPINETVAHQIGNVDYVVHLVRARGQRTPKVFKLTKRSIAPGETLHITKQHSFEPVTTRKYYPGQHVVEVQINGTSFARQEFTLKQ